MSEGERREEYDRWSKEEDGEDLDERGKEGGEREEEEEKKIMACLYSLPHTPFSFFL